jgi:hypothetical protein
MVIINKIIAKIVITTLGPTFSISLISTDIPIAIIDKIKRNFATDLISSPIFGVIISVLLKIARSINPITNQGRNLSNEFKRFGFLTSFELSVL